MDLQTVYQELKPGEKRDLGHFLGQHFVVCGRIPYTGMNRQQRRAMERAPK